MPNQEKTKDTESQLGQLDASQPKQVKKISLKDLFTSDIAKILITLFLLLLLFGVTFFLSYITLQKSQVPAGADVVPKAEIKLPAASPTIVDAGNPTAGFGCAVGGCNNELCLEESQKETIFSTCVLKPEYVCYKTAICERQTNGLCDWTQTQELLSCLSKY